MYEGALGSGTLVQLNMPQLPAESLVAGKETMLLCARQNCEIDTEAIGRTEAFYHPLFAQDSSVTYKCNNAAFGTVRFADGKFSLVWNAQEEADVQVGRKRTHVCNGDMLQMSVGSSTIISLGQVIEKHGASKAYSSTYNTNEIYSRLFLDSVGAWLPLSKNINTEWASIDLESVQAVTGVVTQGRSNDAQWMRTYRIQVKTSDGAWVNAVSKTSRSEVFNGNTDQTTRVPQLFDEVYQTQQVKLTMVTWHRQHQGNWPAVRMGVLVVGQPTGTPPPPPPYQVTAHSPQKIAWGMY